MSEKKKRKKRSRVVDTHGMPNSTKSLDTQPLDYFPKGYTPWPHQEASLLESQEFYANPNEYLFINYISTAGGKSMLAVANSTSWIASGGQSILLCPTKDLQYQYKKDFKKGDLSIVTGAADFKCINTKMNCGAHVSRSECSNRKAAYSDILQKDFPKEDLAKLCPYKKKIAHASLEAKSKPMCFTPYSFMTFKENNILSKSLPQGNGLMIVDEAHLLPDIFSGMLSLNIRIDVINSLFEHTMTDQDNFHSLFFYPEGKVQKNCEGKELISLGQNQFDYLEGLRDVIELKLNEIRALVLSGDSESLDEMIPDLAYVRDTLKYQKYSEYLASVRRSLDQILKLSKETQWACEVTSTSQGNDDHIIPSSRRDLRLLIRPGIIPHTFLKNFFSGFSKIILMSGTMFKTHFELLGLINQQDVSDSAMDEDADEISIPGVRIFEAKSRIPAENRTMYLDMVHGMNVNYQNLDESFHKFAKFIVNILVEKLPGEKGLIHVSSNTQAEKFARFGNLMAQRQLLSLQKHGLDIQHPRARFISAKPGRWESTMNKFKKSPVGGENGESLFLVAARRYEGIDLYGDLARINIIAKVPYPNMKDTIVLSLDNILKTYSVVKTLTSFIQGANRAVRKPNDWALNICLDASAKRLFEQFLRDMPEYVRESIVATEDPNWLREWEAPET